MKRPCGVFFEYGDFAPTNAIPRRLSSEILFIYNFNKRLVIKSRFCDMILGREKTRKDKMR